MGIYEVTRDLPSAATRLQVSSFMAPFSKGSCQRQLTEGIVLFFHNPTRLA